MICPPHPGRLGRRDACGSARGSNRPQRSPGPLCGSRGPRVRGGAGKASLRIPGRPEPSAGVGEGRVKAARAGLRPPSRVALVGILAMRSLSLRTRRLPPLFPPLGRRGGERERVTFSHSGPRWPHVGEASWCVCGGDSLGAEVGPAVTAR